MNIRSSLATLSACAAFASAANAQVFINELMYDAAGTDGGKTFIEIYGPPGLDLSGWELLSVEGTANQTPGLGCGYVNQTGPIILPPGSIIKPDGFFVIADGESGVTQVTCPLSHNGGVPDLIVENADFENGPDEALQLVVAGNIFDAVQITASTPPCVLDAVGGAMGFGTPAPDVPGGFSLSRYPAGAHTGDNYTDFRTNGKPTPGADGVPRSMIFDNGSISLLAGGTTNFALSVANASNGQYLVLASITPPTGNDPLGVPYDPITDIFINLAVTPNPIVVNFAGNFDATGRATATLAIPPAIASVPGAIPFYFVCLTPVSANGLKTNVSTITINP
jgi:hypothetical protein